MEPSDCLHLTSLSNFSDGNWCWTCNMYWKDWLNDMPSCSGWLCQGLPSNSVNCSFWGCDTSHRILYAFLTYRDWWKRIEWHHKFVEWGVDYPLPWLQAFIISQKIGKCTTCIPAGNRHWWKKKMTIFSLIMNDGFQSWARSKLTSTLAFIVLC